MPDYKLGIEYDGLYFHSLQGADSREKRKETELTKAGIILIRLKESNTETMVKDNVVLYKLIPQYKNLDEGLNLLLGLINSYTGCDIPDIDFQRDRLAIYNSYEHSDKLNSLAMKYPGVACEWDNEKNGILKPEMYYPGSNEKVWWKCNKCGHEWMASINDRALKNRGCPACSQANRGKEIRGAKLKKGINDLATMYPDLAKEWDNKRNKDKPSDYTFGSHAKVWWICPIHNSSYQSIIKNRVNGSGCPICGNVKKAASHRTRHLKAGKNDLKTKFPDLVKDWDYKKNGDLVPENCSYGSHKIVWWKCHNCGYERSDSINHRTSGGKCRNCKKI